MLKIRTPDTCKWDIVSLGEVMLRLDPGAGRIHTARQFTAWEGGGEYNVARGLRRVFGLRAAVVTALVDNPVGRLIEDFILQGGVDPQYINWMQGDGIGRNVRNGLNFTERGFGVRGAVGCSDRGHSAASKLKPGMIPWRKIFAEDGARWFHCGGIYAALSETTPGVVIEALRIARENGVITSYDLNYRPSLWKAVGGAKRAIEVNREIAQYVDVMLGNEEDFTQALGFEVEGTTEKLDKLDPANFKKMISQVLQTYPHFKAVATTLRAVATATINDWGAIAWMDNNFYSATLRPGLEIYDRVGGGDSFASGLIYGLLSDLGMDKAVNYGAAHGALAMTTPGDTSMATLKEVEKLVGGGSARVDR